MMENQTDLCVFFEKCLRKIDYYVVDLTPLLQNNQHAQVDASSFMTKHLSADVANSFNSFLLSPPRKQYINFYGFVENKTTKSAYAVFGTES